MPQVKKEKPLCCATCVSFVSTYSPDSGECRHNAPTNEGYAPVRRQGWCGAYKEGTNPIRLANERVRK